jgi:hypothetical protein
MQGFTRIRMKETGQVVDVLTPNALALLNNGVAEMFVEKQIDFKAKLGQFCENAARHLRLSVR